MTALEAYILARAFTKQAIAGAGALKGAPCQIQSITPITGGNRITFAWETSEGETETDTLDVMDGTNGTNGTDGTDGTDGVGISSITFKEKDASGNNVYTVTLTNTNTYDITCPIGPQGETGATGATGATGNGIASITKTGTSGLVDTYTITYTNGQTSTFTVTNGAGNNEFIGTLAEWNNLTTAEKKAFDTYQITDDYSEALMPNYSTVEQKTGQKWIDGKDIYFRTFTGLSIQSNTSWINTDIDISYVETIVDGVALDNAGQVITNSFGGTSGGVLLLRSLFIGNTIATVTIYYTKKA
ncbi:MAG: hypothetical protein J6S83_06755 [Lachnospiraceae bacterium]|nr:hypothetical protein [Lachnospiraceae bacterium]